MSPSAHGAVTARLVEHVTMQAHASLPPAAVAAAKTFVLDSLGVALAGTRVPLVATLKSVAASWGDGEAARIWGTGERVPAATAAFINGYQIHNQEWDCVHEPAVVHPMAVVLATLLAWAEARGGVSGQRLLSGCVLAVDVAATIGSATRSPLRFFRPAMCGALGATAGIAAMLRLDATTTRSALGIACSQLSGTMQAHVEGSPVLPMQIGFNTRAALLAIELATRGVQGPADFLEGPYGYYALFDPDWEPAAYAALGETWRITELSHKPFPSGRATHGGVDGALTLRALHGFELQQIREIRVFAPPLVRQLVDRRPAPDMAASYARLCLPFVTATALLQGTVGVDDFDAAALRDPARQALAARIRVLPDSSSSLNTLAPQRVEIDVDDGRQLALDLPAVLGSPGRPLGRERHLAKFRLAVSSGRQPLPASAAETLIATVDALEQLDDVRRLVDLLSFEHGSAP
jgi:2-methylcitrate dehydratase PrpD